MSWLYPVRLEVPRGGRKVLGGQEMGTSQPKDTENYGEGVSVTAEITKRRTRPAPKLANTSAYFRRGKKLRYKKDKCPKGSEGVVLEVREHTAKGISFYQKSGVFSPDYFEPVS